MWIKEECLRLRAFSGDLRIAVLDKGGEFTVMPKNLDREIVRRHLTEETLYVETDVRVFASCSTRLNSMWKKVGEECYLSAKLIKKFLTPLAAPPVLYTLLKTHKLIDGKNRSVGPATFRVRLIIGTCEGPADRISWLLAKILSPLLQFTPVQ